MPKRNLAFDYGASTGRAFLADFDGSTVALTEVHRFENNPVSLGNTLYWDFPRLFFELKQGLLRAKTQGKFDAVGIDTWGLDFGLLDGRGDLLDLPVHYRDDRCEGMMERAELLMPREELYRRTGIQFMRINTLNQLLSLRLARPEVLERAESLLLMPDLLGYFLTGERTCEYSMASTTGLLNAATRQWDPEVLERLGLPHRLFLPTRLPGYTLGDLCPHIAEELEVPPVPVLTVAGHDTGSAVASVPARESEFAYISSGTWSLLGAETAAPVLEGDAYRFNFTNEGGVGGSIRLLKNIMGLWIIQECRRRWRTEGRSWEYADLAQAASRCPAFAGFFDPDDDSLIAPPDMPAALRALLLAKGQGVPDTDAALARCVYENLALRYRQTLERLERITGVHYGKLYVVGGGAQNELLNQMTADALGIPVAAGPGEATVMGNVLVQLMAQGELGSLKEGRALVRESCALKVFEPREKSAWDDAYGRFLSVVGE